ncbi:MAG TPA: energy-coupling factor transporter transmembrane component T [Candidatus Limnocylindria bacterium]|nr:energy-coupling factor transporter transmembrane component T [Candidatus Limnocylindria bacterium]
MRLLAPLVPDPRAPLARAHPISKIVAGLVVMLGLFITIDIVTSTLVLIALSVAAALSGLPVRTLALRAVPLLISACGIGVFNAAVGSTGVAGGVAIALRLIGISLAGILAVATIDPTDLADALVQHVHAPPRFVVGALAAFRLFPLFSREWDTIGLARRARGIEADRGFTARLSAFPGRTLGLLVAAIRRATRLALAMDARGFGSRTCRTLARPRALTRRDGVLVALALAVVVLATGVSMSLGTWRPLLVL